VIQLFCRQTVFVLPSLSQYAFDRVFIGTAKLVEGVPLILPFGRVGWGADL